MRRSHLFSVLVGLLLVTAPVAPAFAVVLDRAEALSLGEEQRLSERLASIDGHRFDAVFVTDTAEGPVILADRLFTQRSLTARDGLIVIDVGARQVGVHLGEGFRQRGLNQAAIQAQIARDFAPRARQGDYAGAAVALAEGLVARSNAAGGPAVNGSAPANGPSEPAPGFPWWLVVLPLAAGGFFLLRRGKGVRGGHAPLDAGYQSRLKALQARHASVLERVLAIDDASDQARFHAGATAESYTQLDRRGGSLLSAATALGEQLDEAEASLAAGRTEFAGTILDDLEDDLVMLESQAAAGQTALDALANEAEDVKQRMARARERMTALRSQGPGSDGLAILAARLNEADKLLTSGDPSGAGQQVELVRQALDRLEGRSSAAPAAIVWADLPEQAEGLARRWQDLAATYRAMRARGEALGHPSAPMAEGALERARDALDSPPIDLVGGREALEEAQAALSAYHTDLEAAAERAARQAPAAQPPGYGYGPGVGYGHGMPGPIIMMPGLGAFGGSHHDHDGSLGGVSGGADWGGGGGDWGGGGGFGGGDSGSSGGGSW